MKKMDTLDKLGKEIQFPDLCWGIDKEWDDFADEGKMYQLNPLFECKGSKELLHFAQTLIDNVLEYEDGSFVLSWFDDDNEEVKSKEFASFDLLLPELKARQAPILMFHILLIMTNKYNL